MKTYVAFIRGINVGGHKKVSMAQLRQALEKDGFDQVMTYIQSGNVIFSTSLLGRQVIQEQFQDIIYQGFGFEVGVIIKTLKELQAILDASPFEQKIKESSYFVLLNDIPLPQLKHEAAQKIYPNEEFHIIDDCIYFYCENGYGKAKFNLRYFETKLKVIATARNYKTLLKMITMVKDLDN